MRNCPRKVTKVNCARRDGNATESLPTAQHSSPNGSMPQASPTRRQRLSEFCVIPTIYGNPSNLVACHADRPAFVDLVIALDHLVSGLRDIGRKSEEKILRDALLDGNASGGALIVPADERIDLQAGDAGEFLHATADLAGGLRSNHRICALADGVRLLCGLALRDEVDNVGRS
jgi:hypothetical protein